MTLEEGRQNIDATVIYYSVATRKPSETGVIVSVDDRWIYVQYRGSQKPIGTHPDNLTIDRSSR